MSTSQKGTWRQALTSFAAAILLVLTIRWAFFEPYVIPSGSMIPNLLIHDHILVNKFSYGVRIPFMKSWLVRFDPPRRGDVVVFRSVSDGGYFLIKRVVGLPGDHIFYDREGRLFVNGQPVEQHPLTEQEREAFLASWPIDQRQRYAAEYAFIEEKFEQGPHVVIRESRESSPDSGPFEVPPEHLFMMGDNRDNSQDSRFWGVLPLDHLLGRALFVWLSCEETLPDAANLCDPKTIRWNRLLFKIH